MGQGTFRNRRKRTSGPISPRSSVAFILVRIYLFSLSTFKTNKKIQSRKIHENLQYTWDYAETGRYTYKLLPKVTQQLLCHHRNIFLFATNHGPFPDYLFKFNKVDSPRCTCGQIGDSFHYITTCTLTSHFHIRKATEISKANWFNYILKKALLLQKIIECINILETNQALFQLPPL